MKRRDFLRSGLGLVMGQQMGREVGSEKVEAKRWTEPTARDWHSRIGTLRGCNYIPRTAVNTIEMWQADTFDEKTIDQELALAETIGLNSLRVFVHYLVWDSDPDGLKKRIDKFLTIASRRQITTMLVLFDDCWNQEPKLGPQEPPIPGVHNSRWVASPGRSRVLDRNTWKGLEKYGKDLIATFGKDERVVAWDLYNEPGNEGMGEKSLPLVETAFQWAREVGPSQPLTVGLWANFHDAMHGRFVELSDILSFHAYDPPDGVRNKIEFLQKFNRPILCTEFLRRQVGNTFAALLPLFAEHQIGWYFWGLVAGKTQTYLDWSSKAGDPPPKVWQHDFFHPDGSPFDPAEVELLRQWAEKQG
ncbi:MAG: glycoside hydrolase family 5 protein [Armatimonadetes bacterium]|nr:glycoside hydrolase family 5 protein [Armatimonadota bacterium]MDW8123106.1 cellulase family glycosylhydrolase [Armatimonadota bacterium]